MGTGLLHLLREHDWRVHVVNPRIGHEKWRRHERQPPIGSQAFRETAPRPVLRPAHEPRTQRVALDVAAGAHQDIKRVDRMALESTLIHRTLADRPAAVTPSDAMGNGYPVHQLRQLEGTVRTQDEMPVIRENAVRKEADRMTCQTLSQDRQKRAIVIRSGEDVRLTDAAIVHMKEGCGER
jgi:hypothetical protein